MGTFVYFTEEQKRQANDVDLEEYLLRRGEKLLPSGREKRLASDRSITIRGNEWFDHETQAGGHPIDFLRIHYQMSFPEAMRNLLSGNQGQVFPAAKKKDIQPKPFALPPENSNMRRAFAYLLRQRHIDRDVLIEFVRAKLLYEDADYHNIVFVGRDENGTAKHAHMRSTNSWGDPFRLNVEGCNPRYSFHYDGKDGRLYVFEAPIDLLSYISLHPDRWQDHSYVACCGTSAIPVITCLDRMVRPEEVVLCLDNDEAGHKAARRIAGELLREWNVTVSAVLSTTRTEPTKRVVSKGTKAKKTEDTPASSSSGAASSGSSSSGSSAAAPAAVSGDDAAIWAAIAQCESGGNPSINTGNGYYGMYQFSLPTWRSVGGSGLPSDASVEEQTMRARMLQQRSGWGQWGCAYRLGLV